MKAIHRKLKSVSGESISETLVALLIIVMSLTMLAGSIVSAAKVNKQTRDMDVEFTTTAGSVTGAGSVTVNGKAVAVTSYEENDSGYVYYVVQ